jgi:hypothetical protein
MMENYAIGNHKKSFVRRETLAFATLERKMMERKTEIPGNVDGKLKEI